uniref:Mce/MlaD domain-containing protein n=1 Tax=Lophocladia kuetzingii TaxID=675577 RepID=A0A1Z1MNT1_9FLOR|nr:hypothetical protein [Lophocladia kuetzingii]ARW67596.1 hypothetical protein [Lophocladia kuetzingii]
MSNILKYNYTSKYLTKSLKTILSILIFIFVLIILIVSFLGIKKKRGYDLFVEFSHSYGLKNGTSVNFRGVKIGYINNINIQFNKVIVLLHIKSKKILIPKTSIVEANQVGLFNDVVIDITPLSLIKYNNMDKKLIDVMSLQCINSSFLCSNFYLKGYKGLNYDDLIRSTTRISQRFDDPRFFRLFYILLYNSIDISDEILILFQHFSYFIYLLAKILVSISSKYGF